MHTKRKVCTLQAKTYYKRYGTQYVDFHVADEPTYIIKKNVWWNKKAERLGSKEKLFDESGVLSDLPKGCNVYENHLRAVR